MLMSEKKTINGFDVYQVKCPSCERTFEGRFAYPSFVGADGRYCNRCPNLKIWIPDDDCDAPTDCECGGVFDSYGLACPSCGSIIDDVEKQLAVQFYVVEPCAISREPSEKEIDDWYSARREENFLTGTELFVQLERMLSRDEDSGEWRYFSRFEK